MIETIGEFVSRKRGELGYTLKELAEIVGITYVQLCNIENGKSIPRALTLTKLARALNTDYINLLQLCEKGQ